MNALAIIKKSIERQSRLHEAQISLTTYRGVTCEVTSKETSDRQGSFCYRGRTYTR